jgi:hypothetical protein
MRRSCYESGAEEAWGEGWMAQGSRGEHRSISWIEEERKGNNEKEEVAQSVCSLLRAIVEATGVPSFLFFLSSPALSVPFSPPPRSARGHRGVSQDVLSRKGGWFRVTSERGREVER